MEQLAVELIRIFSLWLFFGMVVMFWKLIGSMSL